MKLNKEPPVAAL